MIHLPSLPSGFAVFCDDIRQEVSGKITLVGAYATEMTVFGEPPIVLPQLKALVVCRFAPSDFPDSAKLRVIFTRKNEEEIILLESDIALTSDQDEAGSKHSVEEISNNPDLFNFGEIRSLLSLNAIPIPGPGLVRIRIIARDDEIRIAALQVNFRSAVETGSSQAVDERTADA